ncbi:MAG: CAF17-like 4Fe-4S cluster assembly/insertion protein YgfZ [Alphaproteobacteria bacterium]
MSKDYFISLKNRGLMLISGPDRRSFLQGLVSNDVNLLDTQKCVYACLLSPQGKFLHDFFIYEEGETLRLDCESGARAEDLFKKLSLYKLRAKVELSVESEIKMYAIFPSILSSRAKSRDLIRLDRPQIPPRATLSRDDIFEDPRHKEMGTRSFKKPEEIEEKPFEFWDRRRIELAIPDGSRDMIVGNSTLLECNIDRLNGISWDKGCYMGQELTARMHYRGLVKKRLQKVNLPYDGDVRSTCGDIGLALVKI